MATYEIGQIKKIILDNPNKKLIEKAREWRKSLMRHGYGLDVSGGLRRDQYFENSEIYTSRSEHPVSNRDLFARLLQQEDMIFSARGGSTRFRLSEAEHKEMLNLISDVRYGMSLRTWVKNFGLNAYRWDPMSIIMMEIEETDPNSSNILTPKCYPTYKSTEDIHDYLPNGRRLEYVCFNLTKEQVKAFGIKDESANTEVNGDKPSENTRTNYYRFIDDQKDVILKKDGKQVTIAAIEGKNPIINPWGKVPAFIASDLIQFDEPKCFASPVQFIVELADCFFYDRSIRDLQKKYHGFAKAVEPLLKCPTCLGEGVHKGSACPSCTIPGQERGTGYKLQTKVSDKAMFPLEAMSESGFDIKKIFTYITPDIESWNKQDMSLQDMENLMYFTYWGVQSSQKTVSAKGSGTVSGDATQETATKTLSNLQPKYARLNATADWAEHTETMIADFIGEYWFDTSFKGSAISYSRNYILELPDDILNDFYDARSKGAPQQILISLLERYIQCLDQGNPMEAEKKRKLISVEPFPFSSVQQVEQSQLIRAELKAAKWFYPLWESTLLPVQVIETPIDKLRDQLIEYSKERMALPVDNQQKIQELKQKQAQAGSVSEKQAIQKQIDKLQTASA